MVAGPGGDSPDASPSFSLCLVNDDPTQLMVQKRLLSGWAKVVGYLSALEALAAARLGQAPQFLVTDFHMPGMGGPELAQVWCGMFPQARVLVISASEVSVRDKALVENLPQDSVKLLTSYRITELQEQAKAWFQEPSTPLTLPTAPEPKGSQRLDRTVLQKLAQLGGGAFMQKTISRFLQGAPSKVQEIVTALAQSDHSRAHGLAHSLKGSCGLVGASSLAVAADKIEIATERDGHTDLLDSYVSDLVLECEATVSELESFTP